jgi:AcrR family transcriptional regulator
LARKGGFASISMRQIADEIDISATALYYHFHNKHALLERIAEIILEQLQIPDATLPWQVRLRKLVLAHQQALLTYPGLAKFMLEYRESAAALLWVESHLTVLTDAGLRDRSALRALAQLSFLINPLTLLDSMPKSEPQRVFDNQRVEARIKSTAARYPRLQHLLPQLPAFSYETHFSVALDGVIAGIEVDLKQHRRGK